MHIKFRFEIFKYSKIKYHGDDPYFTNFQRIFEIGKFVIPTCHQARLKLSTNNLGSCLPYNH